MASNSNGRIELKKENKSTQERIEKLEDTVEQIGKSLYSGSRLLRYEEFEKIIELYCNLHDLEYHGLEFLYNNDGDIRAVNFNLTKLRK